MGAVEWSDVVKEAIGPIVGAVLGGLGTWLGASLHFGKKLEEQRKGLVATIEAVEARAIAAVSRAKIEATAELTRALEELAADLARIEKDLDQLEVTNVDGRVKSAAEMASAAAWARRLEEVADQCSETTATLNRILGALQAKGFAVHE